MGFYGLHHVAQKLYFFLGKTRTCQGTSFQLPHTWSKVDQQIPKFIQNFLMRTAFNFMCTKMEDALKFQTGRPHKRQQHFHGGIKVNHGKFGTDPGHVRHQRATTMQSRHVSLGFVRLGLLAAVVAGAERCLEDAIAPSERRNLSNTEGAVILQCIWFYILQYDIIYISICIISFHLFLFFNIILNYILLYCIILYYIMLYYITMYYILLNYTIWYYIMLYYVILYCIILYYIILCYIILYYIILYYMILYDIKWYYMIPYEYDMIWLFFMELYYLI